MRGILVALGLGICSSAAFHAPVSSHATPSRGNSIPRSWSRALGTRGGGVAGAWGRRAASSKGGKSAKMRGGSAVASTAATESSPEGVVAVPVIDLIQPHSISASEVLQYYSVTEEGGLSAEEAETRLSTYGANALTAEPKQSLASMILEQFEDRLVQILLAVAVLSGILSFFEDDASAFVEPISILTILVLNAVIGVWQSRSAQDSLDALKKLQPENACVLRGGQWISTIPASELVPGDVIYLKVGDKVAADGRVLALKTTTFSTDEGSLTGESVAVSKTTETVAVDSVISSKTNMVFSGTMVTGGAAWVVVTATGMRTEIGKIQAGVQEAKADAEKTPLQQKLDEFGGILTYIIGGICAAVWLFSIPHFDDPMFGSWANGAIYYAKVAVALGVAAIPEGLPAVITLCLSLGTRRMAKRNVIVRKLPSVETLGCTTIICTDKTGTLTTNQMSAVSLVMASDGDAGAPALREATIEGTSYEPIGTVSGLATDAMSHKGMQDLAKVCSLCNDARIIFNEDKYERIGEPTEAALMVLVEKLGVPGLSKSQDPSINASQCATYWHSQYKRLATLEFSRDRKSMSVLACPVDDREGSNHGNRLFVKGAPEMMLDRCSKVLLPGGKVVPMSPQLRQEIRDKFAEMAVRPLRCLLLALKEGKDLGSLANFSESDDPAQNELLKDITKFADVESDLTFVGLTGIKDPARPEVADAMLQCQDAGIRQVQTQANSLVMVITGDSKETAVAIAKDVNIFGRDQDVSDRAWTSRDFFQLDEARQLALLAYGNMLFCRTEPADKQKLVKMLQGLGEVPAMTGDGVNDAPALQQAAIGVAMGIAGTEVSKDAADMILADDNFATIVSAVEEGRAIYNNMQAFICFLISCNIGEIVSIFFATLLGLPEPLTPLHLLWVNLVTDGPPATALGFNPPDPDAMSNPPRPKDEPIMSTWLLTRYCVTGLYVGFATVGVLVHWYLSHGVTWGQLLDWSNAISWGEGELDLKPIPGMEFLADNPSAIFTEGKALPQSLSLSVLVTLEMLKALSAVSVDNSMLRVPPWRNQWLILGVTLPSLLHLAALYVPAFSSVFGLHPLSFDDWKVVLAFAAPVVLVEECLKYIGRRVNAKKVEDQKQNENQKQLAATPE
ncbi:unnamed protein product [Chrysoparadoxa australica]